MVGKWCKFKMTSRLEGVAIVNTSIINGKDDNCMEASPVGSTSSGMSTIQWFRSDNVLINVFIFTYVLFYITRIRNIDF